MEEIVVSGYCPNHLINSCIIFLLLFQGSVVPTTSSRTIPWISTVSSTGHSLAPFPTASLCRPAPFHREMVSMTAPRITMAWKPFLAASTGITLPRRRRHPKRKRPKWRKRVAFRDRRNSRRIWFLRSALNNSFTTEFHSTPAEVSAMANPAGRNAFGSAARVIFDLPVSLCSKWRGKKSTSVLRFVAGCCFDQTEIYSLLHPFIFRGWYFDEKMKRFTWNYISFSRWKIIFTIS